MRAGEIVLITQFTRWCASLDQPCFTTLPEPVSDRSRLRDQHSAFVSLVRLISRKAASVELRLSD